MPDAARRDGRRLRRGGCACGAVRFEVGASPSSSASATAPAAARPPARRFSPTPTGRTTAFAATGEAREHDGRSFCPICGSRLFHLSAKRAEINLGALDDAPTDLVPTREGWTHRREPWQPPLPGAAQFDGDPT